ncbi:hypothetical protein BDN70DRAFT_878806 [Pholiota conissans]|uniref:F-box domain-containing protein n=1 Tax=Pholiota conissans TaxID=109636 RepID=A0A9P5Z0Z8_9AGAR|nr:hypothetical protein BDN70DRAFT_878806 [Pholiota conissans]
MERSTIFDLPYEILCHIFDHPDVPNETLFNLALTSQRFNHFALSIYFARFQISNPAEHAEIVFRNNPPHILDALDGLKIALFVPSIKRLVCRFQLERDAGDYEIVIQHMRRLHDLVSSLTAVNDVRLVLGNERCGCCSAFGSGDVLDDALMEWSATIGRTWSKIVEKGCVTLSVIGGRYMGHAYSFKAGKGIGKPGKGPLAGIKNLLMKKRSDSSLGTGDVMMDMIQGDNWRFRRATGTGTAIILTPLSDAAKERPVLRSLIINSMIMVVPPLLHWTISALRLPTVESLHIMNISVNRKCWPAVFTMIANNAPHLTEVRLSRIRQLVPADLLHFLASLPKLRTLHLGRDVDCINTFDLGPFPDFPCLYMLHAPAAWVLKLLSSQRRGLSRLSKLSIAYRMRNDGLSHWVRRSTVTSIPTLLKEQRRSLSISLKIYLGTNPGWRMMEDVESIAAERESLVKPEVGDITSFTLVFDDAIDCDDIPLSVVLPKWLSLFFGLRYLAMRTQPSANGTGTTDAMVTALVVGILREGGLAEISSVQVNGVEVNSDTCGEELGRVEVDSD